MNLHIEAFALGAHDYLKEKQAASNIFDLGINDNIIPTVHSQKNWKYVQTPEGLRLSDGDKVYGFNLQNFGGETSRVSKSDDISILDFEHGKTGGGTAQIHRASPDSLYLTLANGRDNPTFRLEHDEGKNWKYIPSKKMIQRLGQLRNHGDQKGPSDVSPKIDQSAFLQGAQDKMKTAGVGSFLFGEKGLKSIADPNARGLVSDMALYSNPVTGTMTGLYDTGNHLMKGEYLSALGSAGMGALSWIPGAGSLGRAAVGGVKGLLKGFGGAAVRAGEKAIGTEGMAAAKGALNATSSAAQPVMAAGQSAVQGANKAIAGKLQQVIPPKYNSWEHGLQNPLSNGAGGVGLRSPLAQNFNLGTNLRSGVDTMVKNPIATGANILHPYGVAGGGAGGTLTGLTSADKKPNMPIIPQDRRLEDIMGDFGRTSKIGHVKKSEFEGIFGGSTGAVDALSRGADAVKNFLIFKNQNALPMAAGAVGMGMGINKLREAADPEHKVNMNLHPEERFNDEVSIPLLSSLALSGAGGLMR
jgi:hypothetical protein